MKKYSRKKSSIGDKDKGLLDLLAEVSSYKVDGVSSEEAKVFSIVAWVETVNSIKTEKIHPANILTFAVTFALLVLEMSQEDSMEIGKQIAEDKAVLETIKNHGDISVAPIVVHEVFQLVEED